eukprot:CAMPEP_0182450792 /NCGR_PEP_ID=MMETSP1172-20130603/43371_1 /TAXON_ID=708627 /ORGANISM="Timspurckia oligopyrenoides, Strain CCMP3278" /LENGTH=38 /DNA_ID= /DNA_START= /DNA_END= /DNA_ORIENTATION=
MTSNSANASARACSVPIPEDAPVTKAHEPYFGFKAENS